MYCRNCGKQIEDDSIFCKYCGNNVPLETPLFANKGMYKRFLELSKGKQIALIIYGIWFLGWLCFLLANADSSHHFVTDYVLPFFLFTVVIPFIIAGGWHIYKINRREDVNHVLFDNATSYTAQAYTQPEKITISDPMIPLTEVKNPEETILSPIVPKECPQVISSELLLTFARNNGKMQVVNKKISDGHYDHYCQFTSADGKVTRVEFSDRTGGLSSKEISEKKYQLSVNKLADGTYYLDFMDEKQIDDSLPF